MNLPTSSPLLRLALLSTLCAVLDASAQSSSAYAGPARIGAQWTSAGPASPMPPATCKTGDAVPEQGKWIAANGSSARSGPVNQIGASFAPAVAARALSAVVNGDALRHLAQVEVEDEKGGWHVVWRGAPALALPKGCASAWFGRTLDSRLPKLSAVRFSFGEASQTQVSRIELLQGG